MEADDLEWNGTELCRHGEHMSIKKFRMGSIDREGDRDPLSDRNRNGRDGKGTERLRWTGRVKRRDGK
jgi:hypothetical protein